MPHLEAGGQFGPYHLIRLLGQGGFAEVWEAVNRDTGRRLALKVLTQLRAESSRALERFQLEGRLAASISHPRCVYVYAAEEIDGLPVISMELMPGGTLGGRLAEGPLKAGQAVDYILDVLDGLEAAQRAGIIHRDIKPTNCFLDGAGSVKVGDFGISKSLEADSSLSVTGSFLGTPYYASPEQVSGEPLDFRSDLYSVGAVLYELLGGRPPFSGGNPGQVIAQVLTKPPPPLAEHGVTVPRGLQRVVFRLLAKQKEKRYPSYQAARQALIPFSSRGLGPAQLARRFGAIVIDAALLGLVGSLVGLGAVARGASMTVVAMGDLISNAAYFGLTEGFLGGSIGKLLLGLRVVATAGDPVPLSRALSRAAVFVLILDVPNLLYLGLLESGVAGMPALMTGLAPAYLVFAGLLASTMRRTNGFAGVHELASGTRVVVVRRAEHVSQVSAIAPAAERLASESWSCRPFRVVGTLWRWENEGLFLARDDDLKRDVWIHRSVYPSLLPPIERLHAHRPGSLPWLQRSESSGFHWDAYGAPR
ncbi:MAG: protein kinase domain-containing protein, partial [Gemmatimonadales bacterium]